MSKNVKKLYIGIGFNVYKSEKNHKRIQKGKYCQLGEQSNTNRLLAEMKYQFKILTKKNR